MRNWKETLQWFRVNNTDAEIGFDTHGMCLKISRTGRDIGSMYGTAKQAQDATPREHRVERVADLRRGMVLYFDTVGDSNPYGHIVTMIGRVKGGDPNDLNDVLVRTNDAVADRLVVVRGSYFQQHWGDNFQFGATWLNGQVLDVPGTKAAKKAAAKKTIGSARLENFWEKRNEWDVKILDRVSEAGRTGIRQRVKAIEASVKLLPTDLKDDRVDKFVSTFKKRRVLKMDLLNAYLKDHPNATRVMAVRGRLRNIIKALPRR